MGDVVSVGSDDGYMSPVHVAPRDSPCADSTSAAVSTLELQPAVLAAPLQALFSSEAERSHKFLAMLLELEAGTNALEL